MSRFARNKDSNHRSVVELFQKLGCSVLVLDASKAGCPDLLVGVAGVDQQVEVKDGSKVPSKQKLRSAQVEHIMRWRGRTPVVVKGEDDVLAVVRQLRLRAGVKPDVEVDPSDYERPAKAERDAYNAKTRELLREAGEQILALALKEPIEDER